MKGWKNKLRQSFALMMAIMLIGSGLNFSAMTVSAEEVSSDEEYVDGSYMDEYLIQKGGSPSAYQSEYSQSISRATTTTDTDGAKAAIIAAMKNRSSSLNISSYNIPRSQMSDLYLQIANYNPDLFYVTISGWSYDTSTQCVTTVYFRYTADQSVIDTYNAALDKAYAEAIPNESDMTDVQKARALHDYLAQHVEYDLTYSSYTAYNALVNGTAVCQGYTLAYAALLQKAGIEFDYCESSAMNHIWNYVKIGDNWYHADVTWDDPLDDTAGYVRHDYFLNSDTKIAQAATGSTNYHHDWTALRTCDDTTYDNAWWSSLATAIFYINGSEYYLKATNANTVSQKINLICRTGSTEKTMCSKSAVWYVWGSSSSYWKTMASSLSYYDGTLYFNDKLSVYSNTPGSTSTTTIYTYSGGDGYLYGSFVCGETLTIDVAQSPNDAPTRSTTALPDKSIKALSATTSQSQLTYGYTTSAKLTASVTKGSGYTGTPTYQWYKVTTDSSGIETETKISGATSSTYTVPTGLTPATYTYRVKATLSGYTKSADVSITVIKKDGTITNNSYTTTYTYSGSAITTPTASKFTTTAGTLTFEWYSGTTKLSSAPVDAGTYTLKVKAAATTTVNAVEKDFTITINQRKLTITATAQSITYGNAITQGTTKESTSGLASGHSLSSITLTQSTTSVTTSGTITPSNAVVKSGTTDVTANYKIEYKTGTLKITARPITLQPQNQIIGYGSSIGSAVDITSGSLVSGHTITTTLKASTTNVTTSGTISISSVVIKDASGNDVTSNYSITKKTGTLTITKGKPSYIAPTGLTAVYGTTLSSVKLPTATNGTWSWENPDQSVGDIGTKTFNAVFTPKDTANYQTVKGISLSVEVVSESVYRIYGLNRYETSFKVADALKEQLGVSKFNNIILACGTNYADALAGSYLAAVKTAPILMVNEKDPATLKSYVSSNLASGGTIYILGGVNAVSSNVENTLKSCGTIKRLGGANRYETNLLILNEAGVSKQDILICTGNGFADSLSASALGKPILLVNKSLSSAQKDFLNGLSGNKYYILGGTSAVNETIESQIKTYGTPTRIGGATRYETSVLIAQEFFSNPKAAVMAYGENFPDGLSGGPLAYSKNAPLILAAGQTQSQLKKWGAAYNYATACNIKSGAVLGGPTLISDYVAEMTFSTTSIEVWK